MQRRPNLHEPILLVLLFTVAAFAAMQPSPTPRKPLRAVYVHPHWDNCTDQISESTLARLAQSGINTIFVDVYYPAGVGQGVFTFKKKGNWTGVGEEPDFLESFSLDKTIEQARGFGISVHATVSCFGELPAIDPSNELHRTHLREVVEFILTQFPSIDGIHLDYLRYMHEFGLKASGNTSPITTLTKSLRAIAPHRMLSAAVFAVADEEEYVTTRHLTGQDYRAISQHLDFMCPMAYHLSAGEPLEWVDQVSRFMSGTTEGSCRIYPVIQAYYEFDTQIVVSTGFAKSRKSVHVLTLEVPLKGTLRFETSWKHPKNKFSLRVGNPSSQIIPLDRYDTSIRELTAEIFTLRVDATGSWTVELVADALASSDDTVTLHVSDLDHELPGYLVLKAAIRMVMARCGGFCVYALNDLSADEFNAIGHALAGIPLQDAYLQVVYVEDSAKVC